MRDVFGNEIYRGDLVAHVSRHGCRMCFEKKRVLEVHHDHLVVERLSFAGDVGDGTVTKIAKNIVRIANA